MALEEFRLRFGKAMMELLGTAMLVLTIQITVANAFVAAPLAIGLVLVALVYLGGPISGAHYNPAISLSVFCRGKMSLHEMLIFWVFQVAGGLLGALLGGIIGGRFMALKIGTGFHFLQAFLAEFTFTALLCFVVLGVATNSKVDGNTYYGLAIGIVVFVGSVAVGPISGGGFNPAVALGLGLVKHFWKIGYLLWVVLANLLGGIAGAACFYIVAPDEFAHFGEEAHGLVGEARSLLPGQGRGSSASAPIST